MQTASSRLAWWTSFRFRALAFWTGLFLVGAGAASTGRSDPCGISPTDGSLFWIGKPDGSAMEFGLTAERWPAYHKHFPKPVVFTVGEDPLSAWPYIHPSHHDKWAGSKAHTFTIRFTLEQVPAQRLYLLIGQAEAYTPAEFSVSINGKQIARRRVSRGSGNGSGDPSEWGQPESMALALPNGTLRSGDNAIELTLENGSWIMYDFVSLGTSAQAPKITANSAGLLEKFRGGPMNGVEEIVFAARALNPTDGHWYANFGYYSHDPNRKAYAEGAKLYKLNLTTRELTPLLADPRGGVRDPQVSHDGKRVLFSYRPGGTEHYHLYELDLTHPTPSGQPTESANDPNADSSFVVRHSLFAIRQLTSGPFDDIEPAYLPDGGIIFVSSRCKRWVNCWLTQVAVLHRCDPDGLNLRALSSNNEHDNTPWPLPDGRVLYTRWEYVDRSQVHFHHLWAMNPDGTAQMTWFGNLHPGITMIDAKPIPGTDKIVASFSPGHGQREHDGVVTVVDPKGGPDAKEFAKSISKGAQFRDPWAFSEDCFLAAKRDALVLIDGSGRIEELLKLPEADRAAKLECHEPRPIAPRPLEAVIPTRVQPGEASGRMVVADVNLGRNMTGVQQGEIKKLLVLETLPMPVHYTGGMEPISYGGTFTLERILGTVPVEPDGSAYFEVPALRSVFFVALDENDMAVKRMQSFTTVQPGETISCVGCHENRSQTPRAQFHTALALRKAPAKIAPIPGVPDVFDFPRDVQPVLDNLCGDCHGYEKTACGGPRDGRLILTGDHGPLYSHSYYMLTIARLFADGRNQPKSNYPPRALGSSASKLLAMLDSSHYGVTASEQQKKLLRLWIETAAAYPGTYGALGTGMIGNYAENKQINTGADWPATIAATHVIQQRCVGCHDQPSRLLPLNLADERGVSFWQPSLDDPRLLTSRHIVFNLSRPEKSLMLLAPLAKDAGGWGLCRGPSGSESATDHSRQSASKPAPVFTSTSDPDYQAILAMIAAGKHFLARENTRFDMAQFRPRTDWVREMKRYGVLPERVKPEEIVDVYAIEQDYWKSLWHQPDPAAVRVQARH